MASLLDPISSTALLPSAFVSSVLNNHIPPDTLEPSLAAHSALPTHASIIAALSETDAAIHQLEVCCLSVHCIDGRIG